MASEKRLQDFLQREVSRWKRLKIISPDQEKRIRSLYQGQSLRHEIGSSLVPFMAIFGALMVGAGIILFFALNWATIPKWAKVFSILASMVASYHIGYLMKFSKGTHPKAGGALIFLGTIIYGAGIWLIAQIFNISAHWPLGFLYWAAGAFLVAYVAHSTSSLYVGIGSLIAYVGSESYHYFSFIPYQYHIEYSFFLIFLALGIALYALGTIHERREKWITLRYPYHLLGAILILLATYLFSFKAFGYEGGVNATDALQGRDILISSQFWTIFLLVSLVATVSLFLSFRSRDKASRADFYEAFFPAILLIFSPLAIVFSNINFWLIPILFNIILFLLILGFIYLGILKKEQTLVNLGMLAFGIALISRYFEYLWDVLRGYLFFIIGGLLLILLAIVFERKRRDIIRKIQ